MSVFGQVKGAMEAQKKAKEIDRKLSGISSKGENELVTIAINYKGEIKEISINRENVSTDNLSDLESAIMKAYEQAQKNIQKILIDEAKKDPSLLEMFGG